MPIWIFSSARRPIKISYLVKWSIWICIFCQLNNMNPFFCQKAVRYILPRLISKIGTKLREAKLIKRLINLKRGHILLPLAQYSQSVSKYVYLNCLIDPYKYCLQLRGQYGYPLQLFLITILSPARSQTWINYLVMWPIWILFYDRRPIMDIMDISCLLHPKPVMLWSRSRVNWKSAKLPKQTNKLFVGN